MLLQHDESSTLASQDGPACSRTISNGRGYTRFLITPKGMNAVVGLVWVAESGTDLAHHRTSQAECPRITVTSIILFKK